MFPYHCVCNTVCAYSNIEDYFAHFLLNPMWIIPTKNPPHMVSWRTDKKRPIIPHQISMFLCN